MASSGVIHLLQTLKDKKGLEYDKLAEYAILWLSYKLSIKSNNNGINLNDFYTNYIETNNYYNNKIKGNDSMTYKDIIDRNKYLMNIKEISKFNDPFSTLCYLYISIDDENPNCPKYLSYAKKFANKFEELNNDSKNIEDSSYTKLLSTLSNDYDNLKNKCPSFQSLPEIKTSQRSAQNIVVAPAQISVDKSGKGSEQTLGQTPEVTSSSSSISNTLISALSTFSVIPVFFGFAYKYSLFGIDKIFQRQYIRKKLKKIKKSMKINI
ncbi:hypothetical protein YYG_05147 [Plasmodium vinckei petteri]|uniref:CIR protein PIR protein n=1 Tax=Plasmodium vinckei petteri TaxID=138298 RepID=W7AW50_PLAVN|nr:hypothetical protein YYG_05147 [Plasmodium vinckei petteri]